MRFELRAKGGKSNSLMKTLLLAPEEVDDLFF